MPPTCYAPDAGTSNDVTALTSAEPGLKLAFFGDQGDGADSYAIVDFIVAEGADFVLHLGDFDYGDNPAVWEDMMSGFGSVPWFAVVGNHDTDAWSAPNGGYAAVIQRKMDSMASLGDLSCVGEPGVQQACTFRGVQFVMSGIGLMGSGHESFIRQNLGASSSVWRVCGWHLNQRDMQLGGKSDGTGWAVHQECQAEGAMIVNGHEHSYGRTLGLTNIGNGSAGHGAWGDWDDIWLGINRTLLIVNGAGGSSLRDYESSHDSDTWWSSGYTANIEIDDGVRSPTTLAGNTGGAFIEFGVDGDPTLARGYFKTLGGRVVDEWTIHMDTQGLPTGGTGPATGCTGSTPSGGGGSTPTGPTNGNPANHTPELCDPFCTKCADCFAAGGFDEGDCGGGTYDACYASCTGGVTPSDAAYNSLTPGWQTIDCATFDSNM
jgi:hypothetical protein